MLTRDLINWPLASFVPSCPPLRQVEPSSIHEKKMYSSLYMKCNSNTVYRNRWCIQSWFSCACNVDPLESRSPPTLIWQFYKLGVQATESLFSVLAILKNCKAVLDFYELKTWKTKRVKKVLTLELPLRAQIVFKLIPFFILFFFYPYLCML